MIMVFVKNSVIFVKVVVTLLLVKMRMILRANERTTDPQALPKWDADNVVHQMVGLAAQKQVTY
tara:strand:+ start:284 stop:475 length:192 start_codon:yes stop_codon:yes gene_type:complete